LLGCGGGLRLERSAGWCVVCAREIASPVQKIAGLLASFVTRARQNRIELAADQLFDELTRPSAHLGLDWIKPTVEKINSHLGCRLRRTRLRGIAHHGVVSSPAL
jgi:hypothetical protein